MAAVSKEEWEGDGSDSQLQSLFRFRTHEEIRKASYPTRLFDWNLGWATEDTVPTCA
jgi:hypothetical protein